MGNIKIDYAIRWGGMGWIDLEQVRVKCKALLKTLKKIRVP
jgi:hypothetical protein